MSRTSPYKRALAARMIREGKSYTEAGRAIDRDRRTITRWMRDESFLNMLHAHGVLTAGPLRVRAAVDDVLQDLPTEESWLWLSVPDATVLGSLVVDDATCSGGGQELIRVLKARGSTISSNAGSREEPR